MRRRIVAAIGVLMCLSACVDHTKGLETEARPDYETLQTKRFDLTDQDAAIAAAKKALEEIGFTVSSDASSVGFLIAWEKTVPETPEAGRWKDSDWKAYTAKKDNEAQNAEIARQFYAIPSNSPPPQKYTKNKFWNQVLNDLGKPEPPKKHLAARAEEQRATVMVSPIPASAQTEIRIWLDRLTGQEDFEHFIYKREYEPSLYSIFFRTVDRELALPAKAP